MDLEQDAFFSKIAGDINIRKIKRIHCTVRKLQVSTVNIISILLITLCSKCLLSYTCSISVQSLTNILDYNCNLLCLIIKHPIIMTFNPNTRSPQLLQLILQILQWIHRYRTIFNLNMSLIDPKCGQFWQKSKQSWIFVPKFAPCNIFNGPINLHYYIFIRPMQ